MNPLHYPDQPRCKKLTEIVFPVTIMEYTRHAGGWVTGPNAGQKFPFEIRRRALPGEMVLAVCTEDYLCPSVMEMLDVIPETIKKDGRTFRLVIEPDFYSSWSNAWSVYYICDAYKPQTEENMPVLCTHTPLACSLADLIFWLKENHPNSLPF